MFQSRNKKFDFKGVAKSAALCLCVFAYANNAVAVSDDDLLSKMPADFLPTSLNDVKAGHINVERGKINNPFAIGEIGEEVSDEEVEEAVSGIIGPKLKSSTVGTVAVKPAKDASLAEDGLSKDVGLNISVATSDNKTTFDYMQNAYEAAQAGQYEGAASYYKKILSANPKDEAALFAIASLYQQSKQVSLAKKYYKQLIEINNKHTNAWHNLVVLMSQQSVTRAIPQLEELRKINPKFALISAQLGLLYKKNNESEKAIKALIRASVQQSDNIQYRYLLANILDSSGYAGEAVKVYSELLRKMAGNSSLSLPVSTDQIAKRVEELRFNSLKI